MYTWTEQRGGTGGRGGGGQKVVNTCPRGIWMTLMYLIPFFIFIFILK